MSARALFLDRDGVINVDHGYVHRIADFEFLPGIFDLVREANRLDYRVVVATNQAGIGRGYFTTADFERLTNWMCARFLQEGAPVAAVYSCPYHEDGIGEYRIGGHPDRKPNPGMLLRAASDLDLCLARSLLVGDKESDIGAAHSAGLAATCLFHAPPPVATAATVQLSSHAEVIGWLRARAAGASRDGTVPPLATAPPGPC